jgi:hypothetical protein
MYTHVQVAADSPSDETWSDGYVYTCSGGSASAPAGILWLESPR